MRVPGAFSVQFDDGLLQWTSSEGAEQYDVNIERLDVREGGRTFQTRDTMATDDGQPFESGTYRVVIEAHESNLTTFLTTDFDRAGVDGGYGLFGALTTVTDTLAVP